MKLELWRNSAEHKHPAMMNSTHRTTMTDLEKQQAIISQTRYWVEVLIVAQNICPFARKEVQSNSIRYVASETRHPKSTLESLIDECHLLDETASIQTTLLILPEGYEGFYDYLQLLDLAEQLLFDQGYEGVYQLASMHPDYCFDGVQQDDVTNYTNRSPYPMLHLIREASIEKALTHYKEPASIPERNIDFARKKGKDFFIHLLAECMNKR